MFQLLLKKSIVNINKKKEKTQLKKENKLLFHFGKVAVYSCNKSYCTYKNNQNNKDRLSG